ncbi:MAG: helix-turn-helix domain-containing protein [Pseudonocardiaceae bacterium]
MDAEDITTTIGCRLKEIRLWRRKTQKAVAELAGISEGHLSRLESGERALDSRSLTVALANALQVAPSELTALPVPAPANGDVDAAVDAVRHAMMAVTRGRPGGQVRTVDELRARIEALHPADTERDLEQVGVALPALVRDLHTSIAAGRDVAELLDLAVLLHAQDTRGWLWMHSASLDLRWQAASLAQQAAQERDTPTALGIAAWGAVVEMLAGGAFDLAQAELDSLIVSTTTPESTQLAGMLAMQQSLVAAAGGRPADVAGPLDEAAELAQRTGEGDAFWLGFGPTNVGLWRMASALELGDYDRVVSIAGGLRPQMHRSKERQATYWLDFGRAAARLRGRRDEAVVALRRAEELFPTRVLRNPFARATVVELLTRARRDAGGRELRGLAHRMGIAG